MTANGKGPELKIRRAKSADAPRLAELATELGYPSTSAELRQRLRRISPATQNAVFVAEAKDSGVVGWLHVSKQGCKSMSVRSNVIRERAHKFYERNGYEHYKTQKSFRKPL